MQLLSVNVGQRRIQSKGPELEVTGIFKQPADGPVVITSLGLVNDFIGDSRNHGGPDQAVYVYGSLDYDWWADQMAQPISPGTLGENLTITGFDSAGLRIGDRLHIGNTTLEVSAPRIPCSTLSRRMGDVKFAAAFRAAERPGFYCRVIVPGTVQAGTDASLEPFAGEQITVLEMFREHYRRDKNEAAFRRLLRAPVSIRARHSLQAELDRLLSAQAT